MPIRTFRFVYNFVLNQIIMACSLFIDIFVCIFLYYGYFISKLYCASQTFQSVWCYKEANLHQNVKKRIKVMKTAMCLTTLSADSTVHDEHCYTAIVHCRGRGKMCISQHCSPQETQVISVESKNLFLWICWWIQMSCISHIFYTHLIKFAPAYVIWLLTFVT